jgi:CDP-diacylglycerol--glycerol-3-phosphate 3-phosphatidyltransferase
MIDGAIARKMGSTSKFGARLDTVADLMFPFIAFIKFLPIIHIPVWLWIWVGGIAIIKIGNIIWGLIYKHSLVALHTILNKITGVLLFILPLTMNFIELKYSAIAICTFATFATIQEIHSNFTKQNTNS